MGSSISEHCLCCGKEIKEFTDIRGYMQCPRAHDAMDVVRSKMPTFSSKEDRNAAVEALNKSSININSTFGEMRGDSYVHGICIPGYEEALLRLMKYEPIDGVLAHDSYLVCKECVKKLSVCDMGHKHAPQCPVCKTELVPSVDNKVDAGDG